MTRVVDISRLDGTHTKITMDGKTTKITGASPTQDEMNDLGMNPSLGGQKNPDMTDIDQGEKGFVNKDKRERVAVPAVGDKGTITTVKDTW
jgi:hypothetical protein